MSDLIGKIYDEMYSEKITLSSLVANIHEDNYTEVKFSKEDDYTVCTTKCFLKDGIEVEYKYFFINNQLMRLTSCNQHGIHDCLYDRETELIKLMQKYEDIYVQSSCESA